MHIQQASGINTEQRKNTVFQKNYLAGASRLFNQSEVKIPEAIADSISAISHNQTSSINTQNSAPVTGSPKITIVNYQFVISDHANGLVYNYQVVSINGSLSISLGSIVG